MSSPANLRPARSNAAHLATWVIQRTGDVVRIAEKTAGPLLDLCIRLWLTEIFWTSGLVKLQNWTIALYLSAHEYPVSWLDPVAQAGLAARQRQLATTEGPRAAARGSRQAACLPTVHPRPVR